MGDFAVAMGLTSINEGGYKADDSADAGGETYRGVARNYHPNWRGWAIVDALRNAPGGNFPDSLADDPALNEYVEKFYEREYWDRLRCGDMPQAIANEMFDKGVLMGLGRMGEMLQKALNVLNRNEVDYPDISEDGHVGPITLRMMRICIGLGREDRLQKALALFVGAHILGVMMRDPRKEAWAGGWLDRVSLEVV